MPRVHQPDAVHRCLQSNPNALHPSPPPCLPALLPYDLTRGGTSYLLPRPHRREATRPLRSGLDHLRNWAFNLGIRGDLYNGLTIARQAEPRLGVAYNIKTTNTVLRASYARIMETPFNENLVLASTGCNDRRCQCDHGQHRRATPASLHR